MIKLTDSQLFALRYFNAITEGKAGEFFMANRDKWSIGDHRTSAKLLALGLVELTDHDWKNPGPLFQITFDGRNLLASKGLLS